jgi:NAD(P)-dependent dehydrogenase (short-subunit alcohol dehydrogenase family)
MDNLQRRRIGEENLATTTQNLTAKNSPGLVSTRTKSGPQTVFYILHQILDFLVTTILLALGFILPELKDSITDLNMGKKFDPERDIGSLEGKVILVTGGTQPPLWPCTQSEPYSNFYGTGNAGLGKQTITYLSSHSPARIYLGARTASKAEAAIHNITSAVPSACEIVHLPLDLTSFSSIASAASTFLATETRLDMLINNAGIMASPYSTTKEGYEIQFGTNHMGHALLTKLLLPAMLETAKQPGADVRIVTLSSMGHQITPTGGIIFDQPALEQQNTWRRYGASKLANILYTRSLATQYPSITCISLHPGVILTDLFNNLRVNPFLKFGMWLYGWLGLILPGHYRSAVDGALNQTWAATVKREELESGAFYKPVGVKHPGSKWARDEGLEKKLWEWTETELERFGY